MTFIGPRPALYNQYDLIKQRYIRGINLIKPGPVRNEDVPLIIRAPEGEAYVGIEGPKGELGFYIVSDGGISPYRCKIRAPSFLNLTLLKEMTVGGKIGDLIVNFGSIDIVLGEVDR